MFILTYILIKLSNYYYYDCLSNQKTCILNIVVFNNNNDFKINLISSNNAIDVSNINTIGDEFKIGNNYYYININNNNKTKYVISINKLYVFNIFAYIYYREYSEICLLYTDNSNTEIIKNSIYRKVNIPNTSNNIVEINNNYFSEYLSEEISSYIIFLNIKISNNNFYSSLSYIMSLDYLYFNYSNNNLFDINNYELNSYYLESKNFNIIMYMQMFENDIKFYNINTHVIAKNTLLEILSLIGHVEIGLIYYYSIDNYNDINSYEYYVMVITELKITDNNYYNFYNLNSYFNKFIEKYSINNITNNVNVYIKSVSITQMTFKFSNIEDIFNSNDFNFGVMSDSNNTEICYKDTEETEDTEDNICYYKYIYNNKYSSEDIENLSFIFKIDLLPIYYSNIFDNNSFIKIKLLLINENIFNSDNSQYHIIENTIKHYLDLICNYTNDNSYLYYNRYSNLFVNNKDYFTYSILSQNLNIDKCKDSINKVYDNNLIDYITNQINTNRYGDNNYLLYIKVVKTKNIKLKITVGYNNYNNKIDIIKNNILNNLTFYDIHLNELNKLFVSKQINNDNNNKNNYNTFIRLDLNNKSTFIYSKTLIIKLILFFNESLLNNALKSIDINFKYYISLNEKDNKVLIDKNIIYNSFIYNNNTTTTTNNTYENEFYIDNYNDYIYIDISINCNSFHIVDISNYVLFTSDIIDFKLNEEYTYGNVCKLYYNNILTYNLNHKDENNNKLFSMNDCFIVNNSSHLFLDLNDNIEIVYLNVFNNNQHINISNYIKYNIEVFIINIDYNNTINIKNKEEAIVYNTLNYCLNKIETDIEIYENICLFNSNNENQYDNYINEYNSNTGCYYEVNVSFLKKFTYKYLSIFNHKTPFIVFKLTTISNNISINKIIYNYYIKHKSNNIELNKDVYVINSNNNYDYYKSIESYYLSFNKNMNYLTNFININNNKTSEINYFNLCYTIYNKNTPEFINNLSNLYLNIDISFTSLIRLIKSFDISLECLINLSIKNKLNYVTVKIKYFCYDDNNKLINYKEYLLESLSDNIVISNLLNNNYKYSINIFKFYLVNNANLNNILNVNNILIEALQNKCTTDINNNNNYYNYVNYFLYIRTYLSSYYTSNFNNNLLSITKYKNINWLTFKANDYYKISQNLLILYNSNSFYIDSLNIYNTQYYNYVKNILKSSFLNHVLISYQLFDKSITAITDNLTIYLKNNYVYIKLDNILLISRNYIQYIGLIISNVDNYVYYNVIESNYYSIHNNNKAYYIILFAVSIIIVLSIIALSFYVFKFVKYKNIKLHPVKDNVDYDKNSNKNKNDIITIKQVSTFYNKENDNNYIIDKNLVELDNFNIDKTKLKKYSNKKNDKHKISNNKDPNKFFENVDYHSIVSYKTDSSNFDNVDNSSNIGYNQDKDIIEGNTINK